MDILSDMTIATSAGDTWLERSVDQTKVLIIVTACDRKMAHELSEANRQQRMDVITSLLTRYEQKLSFGQILTGYGKMDNPQ